MSVKLQKKGHIDYPERVPNGWRVATSDMWLINNEDPGDRSVFDIANWKLEVYGDVENPFSLTYEEFQKLPHVTRTLDHHCIDGWSFLGQVWNGVEMAVVIERAKVSPTARYVLVEGAGGVSQSFPIEDELFLADGQNNSELPRPAGYPLRIVAPGQFGNRSVKWVRKIKFTKERETDSRDQKYMACGVYDLYLSGLRDHDPWTVDNNLRKEFLRKLFAANTEVRRRKKREEHLRSGKATQFPSTPNGQEIALCRVDELKEDGPPSKFVVNGYEILVLKTNDGIYAIEPMCTHHGTDLSKGKLNLDAKTIRCPLHGAYFDLASGKCLLGSNGCDGDAFPNARLYRFRVESGTILVSKQQEWGSLDQVATP